MTVTVVNLQRKWRIPVSRLTAAVTRVAKALPLDIDVSLVFVGPARMRTLNNRFLGHDYVTDVITFQHGEIIICPSEAQAQARRCQSSLTNELTLYVVHGLLHLAGYDDRTARQQKVMWAKEKEFMALL